MYISQGIVATGAALCLISYIAGRSRGAAREQEGPTASILGLLNKVGVPIGVVLMGTGLVMQILWPILPFSGAKAPRPEGVFGMTITLTGTVATSQYWPVFTPDAGQSVAIALPLMMTNFPQTGSTQDHINAAIAYFAGKAGRYTLTGSVQPLEPTQIFSVDRAVRQ
jgi:hypothetical protein